MIQISLPASDRFVTAILDHLNFRRERLGRVITADVLTRTASRTPVDSGRLRNAFVTLANEATGTGSRSRDGTVSLRLANDSTEVSATVSVPYATHIEYGSQSRAPVRMLQQSLTNVLRRLESELPSLFESDA